ncbi:phycobiliprotein lyase [Synechocystis salina LEGE 06155]|nr:phycobiliprotein lyase [Synechocystis salina LEGE 06155]
MQFLDFITAWEGKWLSQRTNYSFEQNEAGNDKSDVTVQRWDSQTDLGQSLLALAGLDHGEGLIVLQLSWDTSVDWGKPKNIGSIYYGFMPDGDRPQRGRLWRGTGDGSKVFLRGDYHLGSDECLTLNLRDGETHLTERHWYASPNLRLRTSLIQRGVGYSHSAFYSDIRRLPPADQNN